MDTVKVENSENPDMSQCYPGYEKCVFAIILNHYI